MGRLKSAAKAAITAGIVVAVAYKAREKNLTWGARPSELLAELPGDAIVPAANVCATRALTIAAPPEEVWPWLVQIGQDRGGFYSFDALENLIGLDIHSADRIVPEWQALAQGDPVYLAKGQGLEAVIVEPGRALVLAGSADFVDSPPPMDFSWAFVLEPDGASSSQTDDVRATRLIVRERYAYRAGWVPLMVEPVLWVSFVMSTKMMRGIKMRVERARRDLA